MECRALPKKKKTANLTRMGLAGGRYAINLGGCDEACMNRCSVFGMGLEEQSQSRPHQQAGQKRAAPQRYRAMDCAQLPILSLQVDRVSVFSSTTVRLRCNNLRMLKCRSSPRGRAAAGPSSDMARHLKPRPGARPHTSRSLDLKGERTAEACPGACPEPGSQIYELRGRSRVAADPPCPEIDGGAERAGSSTAALDLERVYGRQRAQTFSDLRYCCQTPPAQKTCNYRLVDAKES